MPLISWGILIFLPFKLYWLRLGEGGSEEVKEPVVGIVLKRELTLFEWHRVAP